MRENNTEPGKKTPASNFLASNKKREETQSSALLMGKLNLILNILVIAVLAASQRSLFSTMDNAATKELTNKTWAKQNFIINYAQFF